MFKFKIMISVKLFLCNSKILFVGDLNFLKYTKRNVFKNEFNILFYIYFYYIYLPTLEFLSGFEFLSIVLYHRKSNLNIVILISSNLCFIAYEL